MDERQPTVPGLIAALCVRLAERDGPLTEDREARATADAIVAALRDGADDPVLAPLFAELDAALQAAGLAYGLGAGQFRTDAPGGRYQRLPGVQARAVHKVLRCPAERRCARLERATWATRANPPVCSVYGLALEEERLRL
ncbi:MAG: hypothetical protein JWN52_2299 [Actinomycetia bacterium]|nr:hypothetical protein [Actinomycetes bacterium]